jgi:hypothetical protein
MAVLEAHHDAADPAAPVGRALGKIMRDPVATLEEHLAARSDGCRRSMP